MIMFPVQLVRLKIPFSKDIGIRTYIMFKTSFQTADTVRNPIALAIRRIAGRLLRKLKIAPMMARPAAIGMIRPAR